MNQHNSTQNRRRSARITSRWSTKVTAVRASAKLGPNIAHSIFDVSESGACLILDAELHAGEELLLQLSGTRLTRTVKVAAKVIWCEEFESGVFKVGVAFDRPLGGREVRGL